jgi:hypothetical protein
MQNIGDVAKTPKGKIEIIRRSETPRGRGWKRDPKTGLWVKQNVTQNMIVLAGLSMAAKSIQYGNADQGKTIRYIEVGTGHAPPAKSDTALGTAVERVEIDSWDNTDIASDPVVMIATRLWLTSEGNGQLMEIGLFQESSGAPMYSRALMGYGAITGATKADPCVITSASHGLTDSDKVRIENVGGMIELNGNSYYVDVLTTDTFALYTDEALTTSVDSSAYTTYTSGGNWDLVIPKTSSETMTTNYTLTYPAD